MKCLNNQKGIALITSLMLTLLSLVIVLGILYVVTQGIKTGASRKAYRTAVEASYGGTNVTMYEILPELAKTILEVSTPDDITTTEKKVALVGAYEKINLQFNTSVNYASSAVNASKCLNQKLSGAPSTWVDCAGTSTSVTAKNIKNSPDMTFDLAGKSGPNFKVYSKIVDTIPGTPYMASLPGGPLQGTGAAESGTAGTSTGRHFVYRIEIMSEKENTPSEQGNITVMYEY